MRFLRNGVVAFVAPSLGIETTIAGTFSVTPDGNSACQNSGISTPGISVSLSQFLLYT